MGRPVDASNTINWQVAFLSPNHINAISAPVNRAHLCESIRGKTRGFSDDTSHADGHTIMCEIHQEGVVPPSAEALRNERTTENIMRPFSPQNQGG